MTDEQAALHRLIVEFVARQELAHQLLRQLRPHLVPAPGEQPPRPTREQASATARGQWGTWRYRLHGGGCEMIDDATGEPIQWDSPDVRRFDPGWFTDWVRWRDAAADASAIPRLLDELVQLGALRHHPDRTNAYELVDQRGGT